MQAITGAVRKVYGNYPEKVLQFGEGNFLRAFADWMIDKANAKGVFNGSIVLCQPIESGMTKVINSQSGLYTLVMRGQEKGLAKEEVYPVTSVSRCINPYEEYDALLAMARSPELKVIISNTTEAGIAYRAGDKPEDRPPSSFPAKLTAFLHERYKTFGGSAESALLVLPVELIDDNGGHLRRIARRYAEEWNLGSGFLEWFERHVHIASTLVDRIVTGYPKDEIAAIEEMLGYSDKIVVTSELFNLWVIEGDKEWSRILPIHETDANVVWTDDVTPYKKRKVRILNGAHTSTVLAAYLAGYDTVGEFMKEDVIRTYMQSLIFNEVIPTLDLPEKDLKDFAAAVTDRFENPFIKHRLLDISLNSCAKYCARCLPSLLEYREKKGELPRLLTFSFAAFIAFYKGVFKDGKYMGARSGGQEYEIRDDAAVLEFFAASWAKEDCAAVTRDVLANAALWEGQDLTDVPGLENAVTAHLKAIMDSGDIRAVMAKLPC